MKNNRFFTIIIAIIIIAFFLISFWGYWWTDDIGRQVKRIENVKELFMGLKTFYLTWGGTVVGWLFQAVFVNVLQDFRLVFDIVNTLLFFLLLFVSGKLITKDRKDGCVMSASAFALFFWFLCPIPRESLFWAVGSIAYLWTLVLLFAYLIVLINYREENFSVLGKTGLFLFSMICACSIIPSVSICGALFVYYVFHIKQFNKNAVPLVIGFVIGSVILVFAPGNFMRNAEYSVSFLDKLKDLVSHPFIEIAKYKALWLLVIVVVYGIIKKRDVVKTWIKQRIILVLALCLSIIAFSVVFRPAVRALIFTEALAILLMINFIIENKDLFPILRMSYNKWWVKCFVLLLVIIDAGFAINETIAQSHNNDRLLAEIRSSNGVVAIDAPKTNHRMAYAPCYPNWTWEALANKMHLDSVHVYPYFCQNKYYGLSDLSDDLYFEWDEDYNGNIRLIYRIKDDKLETKTGHVVFTIDYNRPSKWYKSWLDELRDYDYHRMARVEENCPKEHFDGYSYYVIWFTRENAKGITSIKCDIE